METGRTRRRKLYSNRRAPSDTNERMGKTLYGRGKATNSRKRQSAVAEDDEGDWLTLAPAPEGSAAEETRQKKMASALSEFSVDAGMGDVLAASVVEYERTAGGCDSFDAWVPLMSEVCCDMGITLAETDEDDGPNAEDLVRALQKCGTLVNQPPPLPPPRAGDPVLAVLEEDGEWHAAVIAEDTLTTGSGPPIIVVRFLEWPKVQRTKRSNVVPLAAAAGDDDDDDGADADGGEGACEMCARRMRLTFHHLVPRSTHNKYVGRAVPAGLPDDAVPTKIYLGSYGIMVCRPCHCVIHRHAPNAALATKYNTLESLLEAPSIAKWVAYAASARKGTRPNK